MGTVNEHSPERLKFAIESQKGDIYFEDYSRPIFNRQGVFINPDVVKFMGDPATVRILPGAIIGFKGFSFGFHPDLTPEEIRHEGGVLLGNNVEIGAGCTVARATLEGTDTVLGDHVKLDSQVHVAHNCVIGNRSILTAGVVLSGSVSMGESCWIGVNATILSGVTLGHNCLIGAGAVIRKDVKPGAVMYGQNMFLRWRS